MGRGLSGGDAIDFDLALVSANPNDHGSLERTLVTNSSFEADDTKSKRLHRKFGWKHFDHFVRLYSMTANSQIPGG
jgi:hypothetical protein